jgi:plasmid maintenance system antidote protein VapI
MLVMQVRDVFSEALAERGWTTQQLAWYMDVNINEAIAIRYGRKPISLEAARVLSSLFGKEIDFWLNLERPCRSIVRRGEPQTLHEVQSSI